MNSLRWLCLWPLALALLGCSNPGKECCDCLIAKDCWASKDSACYYYYDPSYSGGKEKVPPAQSWSTECQRTNCPVCLEAHDNFR